MQRKQMYPSSIKLFGFILGSTKNIKHAWFSAYIPRMTEVAGKLARTREQLAGADGHEWNFAMHI